MTEQLWILAFQTGRHLIRINTAANRQRPSISHRFHELARLGPINHHPPVEETAERETVYLQLK